MCGVLALPFRSALIVSGNSIECLSSDLAWIDPTSSNVMTLPGVFF